MMTTPRTRGTAALSGVLLAIILLAIAALLFVLIYLALPGDGHLGALLWIGVLALIFAGGTYLGRALTDDPGPLRLATFGFLGLGFAVLLLSIGVGPDPDGVVSTLARIVGLIIVLLALAGVVAFAMWRSGSGERELQRQEHREAWDRSTPPSAFDYAAAQQVAPPPSPTAAPSPPPPPSTGGPT